MKKILASKTAFVSSEHLSIVFQMEGSKASIEGSVLWLFFFFLKSGRREPQYSTHLLAESLSIKQR